MTLSSAISTITFQKLVIEPYLKLQLAEVSNAVNRLAILQTCW